jgi:hypothetical protein
MGVCSEKVQIGATYIFLEKVSLSARDEDIQRAFCPQKLALTSAANTFNVHFALKNSP